MGLFNNIKQGIKKQIELDKQQTNKNLFETVTPDNIFTKNFLLSVDKETGDVLVNRVHKITILSVTETQDITIGKSVGKKLAGAATLGVMTGGAGAVVGALAFGNNKKKVTKYHKLVSVDENGITHENYLVSKFLQIQIINSYINVI